MERSKAPYEMITAYLDILNTAMALGGESKAEALQFWQFVTMQNLEIYTDEELLLYEKNMRMAIESAGYGLTEEDAIGLIHERDVESIMYPDRDTYTQRLGKMVKEALDKRGVLYLERYLGFDVLRLESVFDCNGSHFRMTADVMRERRSIEFRLRIPYQYLDHLGINDFVINEEHIHSKTDDAGDEYAEYSLPQIPAQRDFKAAVDEVLSKLPAAVYKKTGGGSVNGLYGKEKYL